MTGATGAAIALRRGSEIICRARTGRTAPDIGVRLQTDAGLSAECVRTGKCSSVTMPIQIRAWIRQAAAAWECVRYSSPLFATSGERLECLRVVLHTSRLRYERRRDHAVPVRNDGCYDLTAVQSHSPFRPWLQESRLRVLTFVETGSPVYLTDGKNLTKLILWVTVALVVVLASWAIVQREVSNIIFQDDLKDTAAQLGWRTGLTPVNSDADLRNLVIRKAATHDIDLTPKQVTVQRTGSGEYTYWYIAVDYTVRVGLLVCSFRLHFNPTSNGGKFGGIAGSEPASTPAPAQELPKPSLQKPDQQGAPRIRPS